jgi:cytochrome P450
MLASTQTTTLLTSNAMKHLMVDKHVLDKLRDEIRKGLKKESFINLNAQQWRETLDYEELNQISYLSLVINEVLRMDPPVSQSSPICLSET